MRPPASTHSGLVRQLLQQVCNHNVGTSGSIQLLNSQCMSYLPGHAVSCSGGSTVRCFSQLLRRLAGSGQGGVAAAAAQVHQATLLSPLGLINSSSTAGGSAAGAGCLFFKRFKSTFAADSSVLGSAAGTASASAATAQAAAVAGATSYGSAALSAGLSRSARLQLAAWLGGSSVWVYSMVVLGGVTRLTRSGLSMTAWKFTGESRPSSKEDWEAEFDKYRASPEFRKLHSNMTLDEFKFIFWMEFAHRMWGRALGFGFAIPAAYFAARGFINGALAKRLGLLFFMGGTQGLVGWWMVRSGLQEPTEEHATPRVSPYRLAAHLVSAFAIYATLTWTTLDLLHPLPLSRATAATATTAASMVARVSRRLLPLAALVAVTATSGAFVAGMDAGRAYNTFPLMSGHWIPEEYSAPGLPWLRNAFENTAAVQFHHRLLATTTLAFVAAAWAWVQRAPGLPRAGYTAMHAVAAVTAAQFALGIYTLLQYVPVHLGSLHQANALNLFTAMLVLLHVVRPVTPSALSRVAGRFAMPLGVATVAGIGAAVTAAK